MSVRQSLPLRPSYWSAIHSEWVAPNAVGVNLGTAPHNTQASIHHCNYLNKQRKAKILDNLPHVHFKKKQRTARFTFNGRGIFPCIHYQQIKNSCLKAVIDKHPATSQ